MSASVTESGSAAAFARYISSNRDALRADRERARAVRTGQLAHRGADLQQVFFGVVATVWRRSLTRIIRAA
jgi:hypothetical protein